MITDINVLEILKLELNKKIKMTVHGETDVYHFDENTERDGYELYVENDKNAVYGLSCSNLIEVIGVLIQDYANGIITEVKII